MADLAMRVGNGSLKQRLVRWLAGEYQMQTGEARPENLEIEASGRRRVGEFCFLDLDAGDTWISQTPQSTPE